jgi:hypothetical protein
MREPDRCLSLLGEVNKRGRGAVAESPAEAVGESQVVFMAVPTETVLVVAPMIRGVARLDTRMGNHTHQRSKTRRTCPRLGEVVAHILRDSGGGEISAGELNLSEGHAKAVAGALAARDLGCSYKDTWTADGIHVEGIELPDGRFLVVI